MLHIPGVANPSSSRFKTRCPPNERGDGVLGGPLSCCNDKEDRAGDPARGCFGSRGLASETVGGNGTCDPDIGLGWRECKPCTAGLGTMLLSGLHADMEGVLWGGGSSVAECGGDIIEGALASPGMGLRPSRKALARSAAFHFA